MGRHKQRVNVRPNMTRPRKFWHFSGVFCPLIGPRLPPISARFAAL
jgi:hypothetical protein